jgi:hypothetical protein
VPAVDGSGGTGAGSPPHPESTRAAPATASPRRFTATILAPLLTGVGEAGQWYLSSPARIGSLRRFSGGASGQSHWSSYAQDGLYR